MNDILIEENYFIIASDKFRMNKENPEDQMDSSISDDILECGDVGGIFLFYFFKLLQYLIQIDDNLIKRFLYFDTYLFSRISKEYIFHGSFGFQFSFSRTHPFI